MKAKRDKAQRKNKPEPTLAARGPDPDPEKRKRGRPKGSRNKVERTLKNMLKKELDRDGVRFLGRVVKNKLTDDLDGKTAAKMGPTVTQRLKALELGWTWAYGRPRQDVEMPAVSPEAGRYMRVGGSTEEFVGALVKARKQRERMRAVGGR